MHRQAIGRGLTAGDGMVPEAWLIVLRGGLASYAYTRSSSDKPIKFQYEVYLPHLVAMRHRPLGKCSPRSQSETERPSRAGSRRPSRSLSTMGHLTSANRR